MKRCEPSAGHEFRGMEIRLYPPPEQEARLCELMQSFRYLWNQLVSNGENAWRAKCAYAERNGLVPPRVDKPDYAGLEPAEAKATKQRYIEACKDRQKTIYAATKDIPGTRPFREMLAHFGVRHDYQLLKIMLCWSDDELAAPSAHMLQSLTKNFFQKSKTSRKKRFRRKTDDMPLQVRSGACFEIVDGSIETDPAEPASGPGSGRGRRGKSFYNCQIIFGGMKIRGRLPGRKPGGRVLEGVAITRRPDGWWAAIKVEVPVRVLPDPVPGSIVGIDVGRDLIAAYSDGRMLGNPRAKALAERIAGRQSQELPVGRLHQQYSRMTRHAIYNELKRLELTETFVVEKLNSKIGQMGRSVKVSAMRTFVALLKERFGDRVREVDPSYTSQDCSQCGHWSKDSWSYEHGRTGECPRCGFRCDRDVNAARNILSKYLDSLTACAAE